MRRFLVLLVFVFSFGLVMPSAGQSTDSPAAASLAKQAEMIESAKVGTIPPVGALSFMTTNQNNPPDYQSGVFRCAPQTNDSLWFSIAFGDTMAGQELESVTFYGARFDEDIVTWEVHLFEVKDPPPAELAEYGAIQRWAYQAPKVRLGKLIYELNSPNIGKIESHKQEIRQGFELADRRLAFLVKRPPFNANSLRASENKFSAFAGLQLTARKASSGNTLTGSLASNGTAPAQGWNFGLGWIAAVFAIVAAVTIFVMAYKHRKARKA